MKKIIRLIPLLIMIAFSSNVFANKVIVKGIITDANKKPIENKTVKISTDSLHTGAGCMITHTVKTNPNGYYTDTLNCNGDIRKLKIIVENCNGSVLINDPQVPSSNLVESNFIICIATTPAPIPTTCKAYFSYSVKDSTVYFNSEKSVSNNATDSISSRTWYFYETPGSNTNAQSVNAVNPTIKFPKPGTYLVHLIIKTKSGCQNTFTDTVVIKPPTIATGCKAVFGATIQGNNAKFNSNESKTIQGDSIISRIWSFGDSSSFLSGNRLDPSHEYKRAGTFQVCLTIKTKHGCENKYCLTLTIKESVPPIPTNCRAYFSFSVKDSTASFNSEKSVASSSADSIVSRTWYFLNYSGTTNTGTTNALNPSFKFPKPGTYQVYLVIKTKKGCESKYTDSVTIKPPTISIPPTNCKAFFQYKIENQTVYFNSKESSAPALGDSIISRIWIYGDGSTAETGNRLDPKHVYQKGGVYNAILYIKTKMGCESRYAINLQVSNPPCAIQVQFNTERIGPKKVRFNSSLIGSSNDSIVQRTWKFGNNTTLTGNQMSPVKEYPIQGVYTACLKIKTSNGCEADFCKQVVVQDTVSLPPTINDYIRIVSINPNPVQFRMMLTVWSRNNQTDVEIAVFDIYGLMKLSLKKQLIQGNNVMEIATEQLPKGPYYLKVSTKNSKESRVFYKL